MIKGRGFASPFYYFINLQHTGVLRDWSYIHHPAKFEKSARSHTLPQLNIPKFQAALPVCSTLHCGTTQCFQAVLYLSHDYRFRPQESLSNPDCHYWKQRKVLMAHVSKAYISLVRSSLPIDSISKSVQFTHLNISMTKCLTTLHLI